MITDTTMIAYEIFNFVNNTKKRNQEYMEIKMDMEKAYDSIEWSFIKNTLIKLGFPKHFTWTIIKCIESVSFSILINGFPT